MESGDIDLIKETVVSNPIGEEGGKNDIKLKDFIFMPIVEIQEKSPFSFIRPLDIFEGEPDDKVLDLKKYYNYVTWAFSQRNRDGGL